MKTTPDTAPFQSDGASDSITPGGAETRQRILETALYLMWSQSYGAVSVDDICREAKVKKGSFYHFFPSKSRLTIEALDLESRRILVVLEQIFLPEVPPLQRFSELCRVALLVQEEKARELGHVVGCPMCSVGSELSGNDEEVRKSMLEFADRPLRLYQRTITEAIERREIPDCDPKSKAQQIQAFFAGTLLEARLRNDLTPIGQLESGIRALLGIGCNKESTAWA